MPAESIRTERKSGPLVCSAISRKQSGPLFYLRAPACGAGFRASVGGDVSVGVGERSREVHQPGLVLPVACD